MAKMTNPHSCGREAKQQRAMCRLKWKAVWNEWCENSGRIRWKWGEQGPTCRETAHVHEEAQNGVMTACLWLVGGIRWFAGRRGGRCSVANQDLEMVQGGYLPQHGWQRYAGGIWEGGC